MRRSAAGFTIVKNKLHIRKDNMVMIMTDTIFATFFVNGERFTVEDYSEHEYGVYHEDMFIGTCTEPTEKAGTAVAVKYYAQCHRQYAHA